MLKLIFNQMIQWESFSVRILYLSEILKKRSTKFSFISPNSNEIGIKKRKKNNLGNLNMNIIKVTYFFLVCV